MSRNLVQYVAVRRDLINELKWPIGAVIAQACHAVSAVVYLFKDDEHMKMYLEDVDNMHKIVLEVEDENALLSLNEKLASSDVKFKLWIEKPENIPTCLALKPYPKDEVQKYFKKIKLFKG